MPESPLLGVPFPASSADVTSCYPLVAHHLGWWDLMCATGIERVDVTETLRRVCGLAVVDPTLVLEPSVWREQGFTLVELLPDGEWLPVSFEDDHRPDGRSEVVPVFSERPMYYAWPDVILAAVLSRRVPRIVSATRYAPIGRQADIRRRIPWLPGVVLRAERDPVLDLVPHRRRMKASDYRSAAVLRVIANSLVYGNPSRLDEVRRREGWRSVVAERPGPWTSFPIASSVAAGARLLLAVFERLVDDLGGMVAYRDTDSVVVPATSEGGLFALPDGSEIRLLSWTEVDRVVNAFDPLALPDWPVWQVTR